ncbi:MAG: XdhC family protein, partial [Tepidisphaerales bacterium]
MDHAYADIHRLIADLLAAGQPFAVVTVLHSTGSAPRRAGAKAIVQANGTLQGTVGGGILEARAMEVAMECLKTGGARVFEFRFGGSDPGENLPVCGGKMVLLVDAEPVQSLAAYAAAAGAMRQRRGGTLVTRFLDGRAEVRWIEGRAEMPGGEYTLVEHLVPPPRLVIAGGGHVGQALARCAATAGFELVIVEDRPEFARAELFPESADIRLGDFARTLRELPLDGQTFIAIVTRGHRTDAAALEACIGRPAAYIGMMGSRRKVALLRETMLAAGKTTEAQWATVHAPIGLDIGAETPEEIAVSIVAQLITARRSGADALVGTSTRADEG